LDNECGRRPDVYAMIQRHRRLAQSDGVFERLVEHICMAEELRKRLGELTDRRIARLLDDVVCDVLQAFSPEMVICEQAVGRLFRSPTGSFNQQDQQNLIGD
jgi:hypothetical protein